MGSADLMEGGKEVLIEFSQILSVEGPHSLPEVLEKRTRRHKAPSMR